MSVPDEPRPEPSAEDIASEKSPAAGDEPTETAASKSASPGEASKDQSAGPPREAAPSRSGAGAARPGAATRRATTQRGSNSRVLRQMIGIPVSGLVGLLVGYYLLNWVGGPKYNFLDLNWPGLQPRPRRVVQDRPSGIRHDLPTGRLDDLGNRFQEFQPTQPPSTPPLPQIEPPEPLEQLPVQGRQPTSGEDYLLALAAANDLTGCPQCGSQGYIKRQVKTGQREIDGRVIELGKETAEICPECRGKPAAEVTPEVYRALCRFADAVSFVDPSTAQVQDSAGILERIVHRLAENDAAIGQIARLSGHWLRSGTRDTNGVVLIGRLGAPQPASAYHRRPLQLGEDQKPVELVARLPLEAPEGARVMVFGSLVENPAEQIRDYAGSAARVVVVGYWYALPRRSAADAANP